MPDIRLRDQTSARPTVLIVEEHRDTAEMYALGLGAHGFHAVHAAAAADAFIAASSVRPDAVVIATVLNGASGLDLTRVLRRDLRMRDTVIVVLGADGAVSTEHQALAAGCDRFLLKPCEPDRLALELRALLDSRVTGRRPYETALHRIRAEYVEMPGMRLTADQVQRLSGVDLAVCQAVLKDLVRAGFLRTAADGTFVHGAGERSR